MDLPLRLDLINWLVSHSLTGLPENDLLRGFCERCRAGGLDLSRSLVVIDTLHPVFEGRGIQWNQAATNERDVFEYGPTGDDESEAAENWRRSIFYHMLERGHDEIRIDLADPASLNFSRLGELAASSTASARPGRWARWTASIPIG
jgi:adenylate cyclase